MANDVYNDSLTKDGSDSPMELFSRVPVKLKHLHTFGSPVYVLDATLQADKRIPKWSNRARVGIYLGASPRHSRKVALVLSLLTAHVLPQFHCKFNDLFGTRKASSGNPQVPSKWQSQAGFVVQDASFSSTELEFVIPSNIRDGHSAVGDIFYNPEPWILSVMLVEICSQLQFPLTK
jgi:hypothetical protein